MAEAARVAVGVVGGAEGGGAHLVDRGGIESCRAALKVLLHQIISMLRPQVMRYLMRHNQPLTLFCYLKHVG